MDKKYIQKILSETVKQYNTVADDFSRARYKAWPEIEFLLQRYVNKGDEILDLGCGNGRFYPTIAEKKALYSGIDNSKELIQIAREKYPQASFYLGDALSLPFSGSTFDKIYSISVLHHIPSKELRAKFLDECRRALKSDGLLIITVWDLWSNPKKRREIIKETIVKMFSKSSLDFGDIKLDWYGVKDCYIHCFTKNELKSLLKKNGFRLTESGRIFLKNKKSLSNFFVVAQKY